jgi:hypothetical protein
MERRASVALLQISDSNLAAIEALERMHQQNAKERGVLSKHLERNPWLIEPTWMLNKAEARVATWIRNEFGLAEAKKDKDDSRVDFFCVAVGGVLHIIEIKRGAHVALVKDFDQADKYRKYVERRFLELTDPKAIKYAFVQSHLVAAQLHEDAQSVKQAFADKGWVFFTTWDDLIERAQQSHRQFREVLQRRVGETDESTTSAPDDEAATARIAPQIAGAPRARPRKKTGQKK